MTVATAVGGLAGCSGVTEQSFEATPVRLPAEAQSSLVLSESVVDSSTITREPSVGEIEGEVTITSHVAAYRRGPAHGQPTLMEKFIGRINGTKGPGAAVVVTGSDLGIGEISLPMFDEEISVPGDSWSLVVPAAARNDGEISFDETIVLVPGDSWMPGSKWVPGDSWMPGSRWVPGDSWMPGSRWMPGSKWVPGDSWVPGGEAVLPEKDDEVLVAIRESSPEELFGVSADDLPGRSVKEGETFEAENPVVAVGGGELFDDNHDPPQAETVFGPQRTGKFVGRGPAPLGGATFGLGVLSTPNAKIADQSVNPMAGLDFKDLLTSKQARGVLSGTGITNTDEVKWLSGPTELDQQNPNWKNPKLLGAEAETATYVGVVEGDHGPWGVVINLGRVAEEDVVITAGVDRRPVATTDVSFDALWPKNHLPKATSMTAATLDQLAVVEFDDE